VARFAFLCCVTDDSRLAELRRSIDELERPDGVEIGFFEVRDQPSLAVAYNRLLAEAAGWRYKAYVHQDVEILNRSLVADALRIFERPTNAMIGAAGCRWLPDSLVWWDGSGVFGHVLERHGAERRPLRLEEPAGEVEVVEALDGLCLITQHDLDWDEAIPGFHFYDVAQSTRFVLAGYDAVVPRQPEPWFVHDAAPPESVDWEAYRLSRDAYRAAYDARRRRFWSSPVRRRTRRLATALAARAPRRSGRRRRAG
jgi:glycosyl transferase family 2